LCGSIFQTQLAWVCNSKIISCGCIGFRVSRGVIELSGWLRSLGCTVELEFKIGKHSYDMLVDNKLLIEYHGLRYHSKFRDSKKSDRVKYTTAIDHGYRYIMIYEDELNNTSIRETIKNAVGYNHSISVRPNKCVLKVVPSTECAAFYKVYHYLGMVDGYLHLGAYYNDKLMACITLSRSVKQITNCEWEITRMVSVPDVRIHGIWSYLLKRLNNYNIHGRVVSFSDNRLYSGITYSKMGMEYDGPIPQDYYWVKKNKRYRKLDLCASDGYCQIFDVGKKQWIITL